jgi:hypothetical protein
MHPEEHLLGDILGLGPVTEDAKGHAEHPMLIAADERLEGLSIPGSEPVEKVRRLLETPLCHG